MKRVGGPGSSPTSQMDQRIFDPLVRDAPLGPADLATLVHFGVVGMVRGASPCGSPVSIDAARLLQRIDRLLDVELPAMRVQGVQGWVALGLGWNAGRLLGAHTVLHRLPRLLARPEVVAVGEVGLTSGTPPEVELLKRQAELAAAAGLPLLLHAGPSTYEGPASLSRALDVLLGANFPPERVLVCGVDEDAAELALAGGAKLAITLDGGCRTVEQGLELALGLPVEETLLASGLAAGAGDLLALPRALARARRLSGPRVDAEQLEALFWQNALGFFGISLSLQAPG